jgi:hypothetical protein
VRTRARPSDKDDKDPRRRAGDRWEVLYTDNRTIRVLVVNDLLEVTPPSSCDHIYRVHRDLSVYTLISPRVRLA